MNPKNGNSDGRATLRDIWALQKCMDEKLDRLDNKVDEKFDKINNRVNGIEVKTAKMSGVVGTIAGIFGALISHFVAILFRSKT